MKKSLIGVIVFLIVVVICGMNLWHNRTILVNLDQQIKAQHVANKSTYDNMWKTFREMTQVTELQAEQFKDVYLGLIQGRYNDEKLLFKMVQEQNPQMDTTVYKQLQQEISSGRKVFNNEQKKVTDIIREYNGFLINHPITAMVTGFKELDANDFIVTSERTDKAFDTGKDDEVKLK